MKRMLEPKLKYWLPDELWHVIATHINNPYTLYNFILVNKTLSTSAMLLKPLIYDYQVSKFYKWKNHIKHEPLDLVTVQGWDYSNQCLVCKENKFFTYEVNLQWGDTLAYEYVREMCTDCLHFLNKKYIRNKSTKY